MKRLVTALCALALTTAVAGTAFAGDCPFKPPSCSTRRTGRSRLWPTRMR